LEELIEAISFSYDSMTWITWLIIFLGIFQSIRGFGVAYRDNKTFADMKANKDKTGISQFYTGIVASSLTVLVFFIPYFVK
jgi:hypothetical protein